MVGFEEERERLDWLSKLIQQASQLPIKGILRPQGLIFFHFAQPNREENRA